MCVTKVMVSTYRILLFYHNKDQYVLLSQFVKKTNKTPKQEIEKAENKMNDYIERHNRRIKSMAKKIKTFDDFINDNRYVIENDKRD